MTLQCLVHAALTMMRVSVVFDRGSSSGRVMQLVGRWGAVGKVEKCLVLLTTWMFKDHDQSHAMGYFVPAIMKIAAGPMEEQRANGEALLCRHPSRRMSL